MTSDHHYLIESFVIATQSTSLCSEPVNINRPSGISTSLSGGALDALTAAGWANRLGTSLFRLKYGLDAALYHAVLIEYRRIALEAAHLLSWPNDDLTGFLVEFVLLAWLTAQTGQHSPAMRICLAGFKPSSKRMRPCRRLPS